MGPENHFTVALFCAAYCSLHHFSPTSATQVSFLQKGICNTPRVGPHIKSSCVWPLPFRGAAIVGGFGVQPNSFRLFMRDFLTCAQGDPGCCTDSSVCPLLPHLRQVFVMYWEPLWVFGLVSRTRGELTTCSRVSVSFQAVHNKLHLILL